MDEKQLITSRKTINDLISEVLCNITCNVPNKTMELRRWWGLSQKWPKRISVVEEKNPRKGIQPLGLRLNVAIKPAKVRFSLCVSCGTLILKDRNGNSAKRKLFPLFHHHYSSEILCYNQQGMLESGDSLSITLTLHFAPKCHSHHLSCFLKFAPWFVARAFHLLWALFGIPSLQVSCSVTTLK